MNKTLAIFAVLCALPAAAAPDLESARAAADMTFMDQAPAGFTFQKGAQAAQSAPGKAVAPAEAAGQPLRPALTRVSGNLRLNGNAYVVTTPGYVRISLTGRADFCDSSGQVCSGATSITASANLFLNSDFASGYVRPSADVAFYKDGHYVGSGRLDGNIFVSGNKIGDVLYLSGSGTLTGDVSVSP